MSGSRVLVELVVVLGTAALVTVVFQALRLPVVLGYVLAGLLIGPHLPVPLVANPELVHVLSELGVILLMFTIGLELPLSAIRRVGPTGAVTALFEVAFAIAVGTPTLAVFRKSNHDRWGPRPPRGRVHHDPAGTDPAGALEALLSLASQPRARATSGASA